jgi:hypothetical protein
MHSGSWFDLDGGRLTINPNKAFKDTYKLGFVTFNPITVFKVNNRLYEIF